jgi:hypothetical protein
MVILLPLACYIWRVINMNYLEFVEWFDKSLPNGADEDSFMEFLAMLGANMLENASQNSGKSVEDLIKFAFTKGGYLSQ